MKRTWMIVAILVVALLGVAAFASAQGYGPGLRGQNAQGQQFGPGMMGGGFGIMGDGAGKMHGGRGMMGGGPGMMGGGRGMMGDGYCTGESYDPAQIVAHMEAMISQHEAALAAAEKQLSEATDERTIALLTRRVELQTLQLDHLNGKLPVAKALPEAWLEGAMAMAQFDVDFYGQATSEETWIQSWIANRLAMAQQRLTYLESQ